MNCNDQGNVTSSSKSWLDKYSRLQFLLAIIIWFTENSYDIVLVISAVWFVEVDKTF